MLYWKSGPSVSSVILWHVWISYQLLFFLLLPTFIQTVVEHKISASCAGAMHMVVFSLWQNSMSVVWAWANNRISIQEGEMPLCHFVAPCSTFCSSASFWWWCEVPSALHSLVTAYMQRSQAQAGGKAPRSGLGERGFLRRQNTNTEIQIT